MNRLAAKRFNVSGNHNCGKAQEDDCSYNVRDASPTVNPNLVVPADGLKCAPETVSEVEPDGHEPNQIADNNQRFAEVELHPSCAVSHTKLVGGDAGNLGKLHFVPELAQVKS